MNKLGANSLTYLLVVLIVALSVLGVPLTSVGKRTFDEPIVDSNMTEQEAFDGLDPNCPQNIRTKQKVIVVKYYSFDMKVHQGQLVLDEDLESDVRSVFDLAFQERFPIQSVIPISHLRFRKDGKWDDNASMDANNTSAFNYRFKTGSTTSLSNHAFGRSIDINPFQNPYIKGRTVLPRGAKYDQRMPGTLTSRHPVVRRFISLGWTWGGNWSSLKDYQHFEKP